MSEEKTNQQEKYNEYLSKIFAMIRKRDEIMVVEEKMNFNKTELRLLSEIITAKALGERVISTQLAKRLGITRSAISQIVNRLEERGVVKRIAAETDKKIAYVEISEEVCAAYREDFSKCRAAVGALVEEFGEEKFEQLSSLHSEFMQLVAGKINMIKKTKNNK